MKIGFDIMGGDFAPETALEGAISALKELSPNIELILLGSRSVIEDSLPEYLNQLKHYPNVSLIDTPEVITMNDSPTKALSQKPNSSIAIGFGMLNNDDIDVFIGAGNTGAMMVGALYTVKAIEGVLRPTILSLVPKLNGNYGIILDVGVNSDTRQDVLLQFGIIGSLYMKVMFNLENPTVGLFNIGSEREKWNLVTQAAYPLMEAAKQINFIGNVEGYDLPTGKANVVVCDGFIGNVLVKFYECLGHVEAKWLENKLKGKLPEAEIKEICGSLLKMTNAADSAGGGPIWAVNGLAIKGHGRSMFEDIARGINQAKLLAEKDIVKALKSELLAIRARLNVANNKTNSK